MQISSQKRAGDCGKLAWDMAAKAACRRSQRGFFSMNICFQPDQKRSPFQPWPTGYQGSYNEIKRLAGWTRYWPQVEALMITTLTMKDRTMTNRYIVKHRFLVMFHDFIWLFFPLSMSFVSCRRGVARPGKIGSQLSPVFLDCCSYVSYLKETPEKKKLPSFSRSLWRLFLMPWRVLKLPGIHRRSQILDVEPS